MEKLTRLRFSLEDDIFILTEVVVQNPYEDSHRWKIIQNNVVMHRNKNFTIRAIKDHIIHLLKLYVTNNSKNLKKSGSEEQYDEISKLLAEVRELYREYKGKIKKNDKHDGIGSLPHMTTDSFTTKVEVEDSSTMEDVQVTRDPLSLEIPQEMPMIMDISTSTQNWNNKLSNFDEFKPDDSSFSQSSTHSSQNKSFQYDQKQYNISPSQSYHSDNREDQRQDNNREYCNERILPRKDIVRYPKEKIEWEKIIKEKELDIESKRLALEERKMKLEEMKFNLEKHERELRLKMEIKEREERLNIEITERKEKLAIEVANRDSMISISKQQQNIINFLMNNK